MRSIRFKNDMDYLALLIFMFDIIRTNVLRLGKTAKFLI